MTPDKPDNELIQDFKLSFPCKRESRVLDSKPLDSHFRGNDTLKGRIPLNEFNMRICILSSGHSPQDVRVFYKEALSLKKLYTHIIMAAPHNGENDSIDGIEINGLSPRKSDSLRHRLLPLIQLWKKGLVVQAQIYHCHEPDSLFIGYLLKLKLGCKLIYDCHEYHPEALAERVPAYLRRPVNALVGAIEKFLARRADYIITVNDLLGDKFRQYHKRVAVIPNYPRLSSFKSLSENPLTQPSPPAGEGKGEGDINSFRIGSKSAHRRPDRKEYDLIYVGGVGKTKGLFEILKAVKYLKDEGSVVKLILIGQFINKDTELQAAEYLRQYKLDGQVEFPGSLAHDAVLDYMSRARIGLAILQPTDRYALAEPVKLFEYMGAGLAVIISDFEPVRNILAADDCGILVNPSDVKEIAWAISYLLKHPEVMTRMAENGRRAVQEKYNWEKLEGRFLRVYQEL